MDLDRRRKHLKYLAINNVSKKSVNSNRPDTVKFTAWFKLGLHFHFRKTGFKTHGWRLASEFALRKVLLDFGHRVTPRM